MKAILAHLTGGDTDEAVLGAALSVARRFGSHIEALHTRLDPAELSRFVGGEALAAGVPELAAAIERDAEQSCRRAKAAFDQWCAAQAVTVTDHPKDAPKDAAKPSAAWRETRGAPQRSIARFGRLADLIVLSRSVDAMSEQTRVELETALFDTGRPVLLVPRATTVGALRTVMVAWNGSLEAARTVGLTMPILAAAEQVTVATAPEGDITAADAEALVRYLGINNIRATSLAIEPGRALGARLLSAAREARAELLILGAYTHSRVRQMLLGGVTRHVLEAADIPVLMSR
ncbi:universal stress protein [Rhodospirillaceae bacterium SYSU D60014]|uniref:universal stress protein n=1 Tax=Virgifigura deserti TaxID=2268457 RepID=UPI0013C3FE81